MKRSLLIVLVLLIIGIAVWYGYAEYNRTNVSLHDAKPAATLSTAALLNAFEKDSASAVKQYNDKILIVTGAVKKIEADGNPVVILLGDPGQLSSVQCSMDSTNAGRYNALKKGASATLKGQVVGFRTDPLFGTDVILDRCVVAENP
jgi:tRNA_anti-like